MSVTVTEIWRYPVKSMGGERLDNVAVDERGMVADRMWAVRDPELGSITTARRRPALLRCGARYAADPLGSAPEVVIVLPDGEEISSADPAVHARLSELVGSEVRLEPIPPPSDKDAYRAPRETKAEIRAKFGLAEDEPLPDLSVFPLRKLAELSRYVTPVGSLVDAYPVHVITRASLAAMAALTPGSDFDVRRFRPNLVVDTEPGRRVAREQLVQRRPRPAERRSARRDPHAALRHAYPRAARAPDRHPSDAHRGKAREPLPRNLCDGEQPGHHRRW